MSIEEEDQVIHCQWCVEVLTEDDDLDNEECQDCASQETYFPTVLDVIRSGA